MTETVMRLYSTSFQALRAAGELKKRGYDNVHTFTAEQGGSGDGADAKPSEASLIEAMVAASIYRPHAAYFAPRIVGGASLVAVHAIFGTAGRAIGVLESVGPLPDRIAEPPTPSYLVYDERIPFSSSLGLPVLTETARLPFEIVSGVGSLTQPHRTYTGRFLPLLTRFATPLSGLFALPTLTRIATPLSSMFFLGTKTRAATPLSSAFRIPLLTKGR